MPLANDVSSCNDNKSAINLNDSKCYLIKETVTTNAQDTKECDRNLNRALAQFKSEDNKEYYSHLFGACDYYTIASINKAFFHKNNDDLFMTHFNVRSLQKHIETAVSSVAKRSLSVREVWGSIPGPVKSTQCRQRLATVATFLRSCAAQALCRGHGPRNSLHASA